MRVVKALIIKFLFQYVPSIEGGIIKIIHDIKVWFDPYPPEMQSNLGEGWMKKVPEKYVVRYTKFMHDSLENAYLRMRIKKVLMGESFYKKGNKNISDLFEAVEKIKNNSDENYETILRRIRYKSES